MTQVKVQLDRAMETSLATLYGKAIDARMTPSILHDQMAAQALSRIDYDFSRMKAMNERVAPNAAARSKHRAAAGVGHRDGEGRGRGRRRHRGASDHGQGRGGDRHKGGPESETRHADLPSRQGAPGRFWAGVGNSPLL